MKSRGALLYVDARTEAMADMAAGSWEILTIVGPRKHLPKSPEQLEPALRDSDRAAQAAWQIVRQRIELVRAAGD